MAEAAARLLKLLPSGWALLAVLALPVLALLLVRRWQSASLRALPGPKPVYPVIGSLHLLPSDVSGFLHFFMDLAKRFPGIFHLQLLNTDYVIINSPEAAASIFGSNIHIQKGSDYDTLVSWLGEGLLISTGAKWAKRRKMLTPAFHFDILDQFVDVFNEQANVLVAKLRETNGKKVNIFPLVTHATLDIICESVMGVQMNAQQDADTEYVRAVNRMSEIAFIRFLKPWLRSEALYRWTSYYRSEVAALRVLHGFTETVIKSRKRQLDEAGVTSGEALMEQQGRRLALLDLLIFSKVDGQPLSTADIRAEVDTFMFEGHDTTSAGINWTLYNLGRHPDVQQKAFQEVCDVLGDQDRDITREDLTQMKYLDMVVKEALRLLPPVPIIQRRLAEDAVIDGHRVPREALVGLFIYAIHRDPRHWPDPERFDPERFSAENSRGRHPYSYVPFSAGPRNCIGQRFAMMDEKVVVATILRNFKITSYDNYSDLKLRADVILRLDGGLWLSFAPRTV